MAKPDRRLLARVALRNYKSIAACDVRPAQLTFLVGANGCGKSNFLDALRFVADALRAAKRFRTTSARSRPASREWSRTPWAPD